MPFSQLVGDDQTFPIPFPCADDVTTTLDAIGKVVEIDRCPEAIAEDSGLIERFFGQCFAACPIAGAHIGSGEVAEEQGGEHLVTAGSSQWERLLVVRERSRRVTPALGDEP